jgi:AAA domain
LTERSNTFDMRPVLQEFAAAAQVGAFLVEVREMASRFTARVDVLATRRGEMTTAELVDIERRLIAAVMGRAREDCGVVEAELVERVIAGADRELTAEQARAVRAVTGGGHGVSVIEALAGTGKTYTAGVLREVFEAAGVQVMGVAPTGRSARELTEEAGISACTLDGLLGELERFDQGLPQGCVVVLDEAGMAATRASAKLLQAAERAGAKVVAIGDPGQLASVQAGGWLGTVGRRLGAVRLTEVMRQRDPAERRALAALHDRKPAPYLQWADQAGRIETFEESHGARERALAGWMNAVMPRASMSTTASTTCATPSARRWPRPACRCARCRSGWATATYRPHSATRLRAAHARCRAGGRSVRALTRQPRQWCRAVGLRSVAGPVRSLTVLRRNRVCGLCLLRHESFA